MNDLSCKSCLWWVSRDLVPKNNTMLPDGYGECRRRAPSGMTMSISTKRNETVAVAAFRFPPVADEDYCGDWVEGKVTP